MLAIELFFVRYFYHNAPSSEKNLKQIEIKPIAFGLRRVSFGAQRELGMRCFGDFVISQCLRLSVSLNF